MALPNSYLITTKNLEAFLNTIQSAQAPERFTTKFLNQLDFTSSNDRLLIGVLKSLGFIDESGVPKTRYYAFLDQTQSSRVLAEAIREAYSDLFAINKNAQDLAVDEVKNKFRTLTQGSKSDNVISLMANTFKSLSEHADWKTPSVPEAVVAHAPVPEELPSKLPSTAPQNDEQNQKPMQLHYNVQIHLPESRDPAVFDAIFQALRKHLS